MNEIPIDDGATRAVDVTTHPSEFDERRHSYLERVHEKLDPDRLRRLLMQLVDIDSPTGAELPIATFLSDYLRNDVGVRSDLLPIGVASGNVTGELPGAGKGVRLMLYAPLDTHLDLGSDGTWIGPPRADMLPHATVDGDLVIGLGAGNPKCMVAALVEVIHAVKEADLPLLGDLVVGFAGGGMPISTGRHGHPGLGSGVHHLLTHAQAPDMAVIMKPSWAVFSEEPGLSWFRIVVHGTFGYAGMRRGTPGFRSSIVPAATVIAAIEEWLPQYTARNTSGTTRPEGWITGVRAGDPTKAAFPSATTEIYLDIRVNPRSSPAEVGHQVAEMLDGIRACHSEIRLDWEMIASLPGGLTDPDHWIVQSCQRGWADVEGRAYTSTPLVSGQSDGALIRRWGIPCARIGYPWPPVNTPTEFSEGLGGMGVISIADVMLGARVAAYAVVDTLSRSRAEVEGAQNSTGHRGNHAD